MSGDSRAVMASTLASAAAVPQPPGAVAQLPSGSTRMVDVMGSPTRVLTLGLDDREDGQPVLFLHSGGGSPLEAWGDWVSTIARLAPVVAYDRPGLGQSPFDDQTPTPERVVAHAHELMGVLDVDPPYILVGHSWGGPLILFYAGQYPDEVVGMVYLDPTEPDLMPDQYPRASNEDRAIAGRNLPAGMRAEQQAYIDFRESAPEDRGLPVDPEVPTAIVLSAREANRHGGPSFMDEEWLMQRLARFVARVRGNPRATLLIATDAGHFVHRDAPTLAEEAVRRVVDQVAEAASTFVVSEEILTSYVGNYELSPTLSMAVTLEDGALFLQATNQGRLGPARTLLAETETEFFLRVGGADAQISFERDGDGTVTGLVFHGARGDMPGRKVR